MRNITQLLDSNNKPIYPLVPYTAVVKFNASGNAEEYLGNASTKSFSDKILDSASNTEQDELPTTKAIREFLKQGARRDVLDTLTKADLGSTKLISAKAIGSYLGEVASYSVSNIMDTDKPDTTVPTINAITTYLGTAAVKDYSDNMNSNTSLPTTIAIKNYITEKIKENNILIGDGDLKGFGTTNTISTSSNSNKKLTTEQSVIKYVESELETFSLTITNLITKTDAVEKDNDKLITSHGVWAHVEDVRLSLVDAIKDGVGNIVITIDSTISTSGKNAVNSVAVIKYVNEYDAKIKNWTNNIIKGNGGDTALTTVKNVNEIITAALENYSTSKNSNYVTTGTGITNGSNSKKPATSGAILEAINSIVAKEIGDLGGAGVFDNYYTKTEADKRYALTAHKHSEFDNYYTNTEADKRYALTAHKHSDFAYAVNFQQNITLDKNAVVKGKIQAAEGFFQESDIRLKNIHKDIDVDLDKLQDIRKIFFDYKSDYTKKEHMGVIAQDVEKIFPQVVNKDVFGNLTVDYTKLGVVALDAIDKLYKMIQELRDDIEK